MSNPQAGEHYSHPHAFIVIIIIAVVRVRVLTLSYRTPSTSSSASPDLARASSHGLPMTPTNSYPNSPYAFASLSPHLEPFVSDPNLYPRFAGEVQAMDMGTHHYRGGGMLTEYVGWREVKDGTHAFGENLGLFVDMDPVF